MRAHMRVYFIGVLRQAAALLVMLITIAGEVGGGVEIVYYGVLARSVQPAYEFDDFCLSILHIYGDYT